VKCRISISRHIFHENKVYKAGAIECHGTLFDAVIDYGFQSVSKKGYVKAKWWQQSRTWHEDGVNAGTH